MAKLINRFSWSYSAAEDFEQCRRKRYWSKYAMWGGWDRSASAIQQAAYRLNKMQSRYTLRGHAVEAAVLWVLKQHRQGRAVTTEEAYQEVARSMLNNAWQESRKGKWKENPKTYCCLHEHYYPDFLGEQHQDWPKRIAGEVQTCIDHFIVSVLPRLADVRAEDEVRIASVADGDPESFDLESVKIYAIPDFVYRKDGHWHIHDWKSGKRSAGHLKQLAVYGLWAMVKHHVPVEQVQVHVEYLLTGETVQSDLEEKDIESIKDHIASSIADMSDYLVGGDLGRNESCPREEWDLTTARDLCRRCNFYELCAPELKDSP